MKMKYWCFLVIFLACGTNAPTDDAQLQQLKSWMTGSFSSAEQAAADTNYFDIRLEMVPIWPERTDAFWLYVEQAAAWSLERPYRQRVYRLSRRDAETLESAVFELPHPLRFAGAWQEKQPLAQLTPDSLTERTGCAILLEFQDGAFVGSTTGQECTSELHGAAYATSEVRIEPTVLTSWDRGFDAAGKQVWGAETGPYIFRKK